MAGPKPGKRKKASGAAAVALSSTQSLDELRAKLGAPVPDELLQLALTHPSATGEGAERTLHSNQRLEFLGDTVVGAVVAEHLYRANETLPEGELTQRKATIVRGTSLARAALRLGLGQHLRLGRGEEASGGRSRDTILADAFEAVVAAIYLSCGIEATRAFVANILADDLAHAVASTRNSPFVSVKNLLQERTQAIGLGTPRYQTTQIGEAQGDKKRFTSQVLLLDEVRGRGQGHTKKEAESNAAQAALDAMTETDDGVANTPSSSTR
jgi:ribonuclease-3